MVKVLLGAFGENGFSGYWAEFDGEVVHKYESEGVAYTLYKCTSYNWDAYRVHVSDESEPGSP